MLFLKYGFASLSCYSMSVFFLLKLLRFEFEFQQSDLQHTRGKLVTTHIEENLLQHTEKTFASTRHRHSTIHICHDPICEETLIECSQCPTNLNWIL